MSTRRLDIGDISTLFREESNDEHELKTDNLMDDSDDEYLIMAAEQFDQKKLMDDDDDIYLIKAAEIHERKLHCVPDSMRHLLQDSQHEIEKKRIKAMVIKRNKEIGLARVNYVSEYFYHVIEWPPYAVKLLFTKELHYVARMQLACFFYGNGLQEGDIAGQIFRNYNPNWAPSLLWLQRMKEFEKVFIKFSKNPEAKANYWYYDMHTNRNLYLNGLLKR